MQTEIESDNLLVRAIETVCNRNMAEQLNIDEMNVWDIIRYYKDMFEFIRSEFVYKGNHGVIYRLHMKEHIGKDMFKKLIKSPLIGGYKGTAYQKEVQGFVIYDKNIQSALQSILGVRNG